jgi:hypothetical protein
MRKKEVKEGAIGCLVIVVVAVGIGSWLFGGGPDDAPTPEGSEIEAAWVFCQSAVTRLTQERFERTPYFVKPIAAERVQLSRDGKRASCTGIAHAPVRQQVFFMIALARSEAGWELPEQDATLTMQELAPSSTSIAPSH